MAPRTAILPDRPEMSSSSSSSSSTTISDPNPDPIPSPPPSSKSRKTRLVLLVSTGAVFSPLSSNIYFPALNSIAAAFSTTSAAMALTITVYLIFQGISPCLWGPLADKYGRRPVFLTTMAVYIAACVGLACSSNYGMLMAFRGLQAAGSASTISLASGLISDVAMSGELGGLMGTFSGVRMCGQAFGPVLGGALSHFLGFRSIFYFLVITATLVFANLVLFLPETLPDITQDGKVQLKGIYRPLAELIWSSRTEEAESEKIGAPEMSKDEEKLSFKLLAKMLAGPFKLLAERDVAVILFFGSIIYASWSMVLASTAPLMKQHHGWSDVIIGLAFMPNGFGCVVASWSTGRFMDRNYKRASERYCAEHGLEKGTKLTQERHPDFQFERARMHGVWWLTGIFVFATALYGWSIRWHPAVPLTLQFFISFSSTAVFNQNSTLMVDLFPGQSASATAIINLTRCLVAAVGVSVIDKLLEHPHIGEAPAFMGLASIVSVSTTLVVLQRVYGSKWRAVRVARWLDEADVRATPI
ncbi:MFS general substrate transporter [Aulographum hederae CBS 113979]|uniref:MFS general substrate transporter n=1 Tax=Aulographum hederae CBS 113979 TaxID=1176131 RepID=A0A6G1HFJ7_9PEZI|nr:MFS general substrate transporter [Aulographum hederae CBS 113979]